MVKRYIPKSDVNKGDLNFATPLHYACRRNNSEIIRLLIAAGAKTEVKNKSGTFPIREALSYNFSPKQLDALKTMIEAGANPNVTDDDEMTLLMSASKYGDAYLDIVKYLLSIPAVNINAVDVSGNTALMYAAQAGYPDVVNYLLSKKAGNYLNKQNKSAYDLCMAGAKKHLIFLTTSYYTPPMPKRYQDTIETLKAIPVNDEPPVPESLQVNVAAVEANKLALLEGRVNLYMNTYKLKRRTAEKYALAVLAVREKMAAMDEAAEKAGVAVDESKYPTLPPVPPPDAVSIMHNPVGVALASKPAGPAKPQLPSAAHGRPAGPIGSAPARVVRSAATPAASAASAASFARLTAPKKVVAVASSPAPSVKLAAPASASTSASVPAKSPAKPGNLKLVGVSATKRGGKSKRNGRQTRKHL